MPANLSGDGSVIEMTATRAMAEMALVLGDLGDQLGQLGDLVPGRFGIGWLRFGRQRALAAVTQLGQIRDKVADAIRGQPELDVWLVPFLSSGLATGRLFRGGFGSLRGIGRGRHRGVGGVLVQTSFEFAEPLFHSGESAESLVQLSDLLLE